MRSVLLQQWLLIAAIATNVFVLIRVIRIREQEEARAEERAWTLRYVMALESLLTAEQIEACVMTANFKPGSTVHLYGVDEDGNLH